MKTAKPVQTVVIETQPKRVTAPGPNALAAEAHADLENLRPGDLEDALEDAEEELEEALQQEGSVRGSSYQVTKRRAEQLSQPVIHTLKIAAKLAVFYTAVWSVSSNVEEPGWSFLDSVYYGTVLMSTVGYGDCAQQAPPQTTDALVAIAGPAASPCSRLTPALGMRPCSTPYEWALEGAVSGPHVPRHPDGLQRGEPVG